MRAIRSMLALCAVAAMLPSASALAQPGQSQQPGEGFQPPKWKITVIEKGENARTLRYSPKIDRQQVIEMRSATEQSAEMNGQPAGAPASLTVAATYAVTPKSQRSGEIRYQGEFVDFGVQSEGMLGQQMRVLLDALIGTKVDARMDERGQVSRMDIQTPGADNGEYEDQASRIVQQIDQLGVVFPREEIGVGGKWRQEGTIRIEGIDVQQTNEYTIIAFDGDRVRIGLRARHEAGQQTLEIAQAPGVEVELESLTGTSEGVVVVDLSLLAPVEAQAESNVELVMRTEQMGQAIELKQLVNTTTSIEEPREIPAGEGGPGE